MRITPTRARLLLALIVTVDLVVALALYASGRSLSTPQFLAVSLLPWIVGIADRRGWLWRDRTLERWTEEQDGAREEAAFAPKGRAK